jgi:hypothetical protein
VAKPIIDFFMQNKKQVAKHKHTREQGVMATKHDNFQTFVLDMIGSGSNGKTTPVTKNIEMRWKALLSSSTHLLSFSSQGNFC